MDYIDYIHYILNIMKYLKYKQEYNRKRTWVNNIK